MQVKKRNNELEDFDASKINKVVEWACENFPHTSASEVCMNAEISIHDKIETSDIHQVLIESAKNLITEENPHYSSVAARLLNYKLRKEVWGGFTPPKLYDFITKMVDRGYYDPSITDEMYTEEEINKLGEKIDHSRDDLLQYAGIRQLCDKYLVQDRSSKQIFETPQFVYMLIAMVLFNKYPKSTRMTYVKRAYNYFSKQKINLPTPIMAGVRTTEKSGASCCLMRMDDDLKSIGSTSYAAMLATSSKYGIGIDMSNVRCIDAPVRGGETIHTGVIPFLKVVEGNIKSCKQGGARRGAGTVTFTIFHPEIEDIVQLKDNSAVEEKRVNQLDYSITVSKLFWERFLNDEDITLFSYHEAKEVYDAFGTPEFDEVYARYERKTSLKFKKTISAKKLFSLLFKQRIETGRIYLINIDHANKYSPWKGRVTMSNLCLEILHEIDPFYDIHGEDGDVGICILGATNMLNISSDAEHEKVCDVAVRMLDELIDYQDYFATPAERFAIKKRSIGVGVLNMAAWLAKKGIRYDDEEAPNEVSQFFEKQQYYLMKSSVELAKEKGPCEYSPNSDYTAGILPNLNYKKDIDDFVNHPLSCDWDQLAEDLKTYGIRNATLSAQMPCESSSKTFGATNGIEPPKSTITHVKSKGSTLPCLIPNIRNKSKYTFAFDMENQGYLKCVAALQRWLCMGVSTNLYYRYSDYEDNMLPTQEVIMDHLKGYKWGIKTFYYLNTDDGDKQCEEEVQEETCEGGACSI